MQSVAASIQTAVAAWLILGQPFFGRFKYERLKYNVPRGAGARSRFYMTSMVNSWGLVLLVLLGLRLGKTVPAGIGLSAPAGLGMTATWAIVAAAVVTVAVAVVQLYRYADARAAYRKKLEKVAALLPATNIERLFFAGLSITAGICEEILYRGFLPFYLMSLLPGLPLWAALIPACAAFGLVHWYQGWSGVVQTAVLGLIFAGFYVATGSLYGAMAVHALVDLLALALSWIATSRA